MVRDSSTEGHTGNRGAGHRYGNVGVLFWKGSRWIRAGMSPSEGQRQGHDRCLGDSQRGLGLDMG